MPCAIFHVPILFLLFLATPLLAGLLDILHYNPDRPIFPQRIDEDCIKSTFGCGCTGRSFSNLTFAASNFDFHASYVWTTPAHQNSWGFLSFNVTNTAVGYDNICIASSNRVPDFFYGDTWYDCDVQGAAGPDVVNSTDVMGAGFTYDRPSGQFHWYQRWACKDQVPETYACFPPLALLQSFQRTQPPNTWCHDADKVTTTTTTTTVSVSTRLQMSTRLPST